MSDKCVAFLDIINRAARDLPEGYEIVINVEKHYGGITLIDPDGREYTGDSLDQDGSLDEQFIQAIEVARKHSGVHDASTDSVEQHP